MYAKAPRSASLKNQKAAQEIVDLRKAEVSISIEDLKMMGRRILGRIAQLASYLAEGEIIELKNYLTKTDAALSILTDHGGAEALGMGEKVAELEEKLAKARALAKTNADRAIEKQEQLTASIKEAERLKSELGDTAAELAKVKATLNELVGDEDDLRLLEQVSAGLESKPQDVTATQAFKDAVYRRKLYWIGCGVPIGATVMFLIRLL